MDDGWTGEDEVPDEDTQDVADVPEDQRLTDKAINLEIDRLLSLYRPERYETTEHKWRRPVNDAVALLLKKRLSSEQILWEIAAKRVNSREQVAPRRINAILRNIVETGQFPLGWGTPEWKEVFKDVLHLPLSIRRQGETGNWIRIQFGAMTKEDWVEWVEASRRDADERHTAAYQAADGGEFILKTMEIQGVERTDQTDFRNIEKPPQP